MTCFVYEGDLGGLSLLQREQPNFRGPLKSWKDGWARRSTDDECPLSSSTSGTCENRCMHWLQTQNRESPIVKVLLHHQASDLATWACKKVKVNRKSQYQSAHTNDTGRKPKDLQISVMLGMHVYIDTYAHTYMYMRKHLYIYTYIYICVYTHVYNRQPLVGHQAVGNTFR